MIMSGFMRVFPVAMWSCVLALMSGAVWAGETWIQDPITGCEIWDGGDWD